MKIWPIATVAVSPGSSARRREERTLDDRPVE
jgi:hypothetical protein